MSSVENFLKHELIHQLSSDEIDLDNKSYTFYCGFDPTGDTLHVGHLYLLITMMRLQKLGHKPIALLGGATGMIGDPSGKSKERVLLTEEIIDHNLKGISKQIKKFIKIEDGAKIVNNMDWFKTHNFVSFLRDIGKMFRVTEMMAKESVKKRLSSDEGMSFTEFSYQVLQAYDYLYLNENHDCNLQVGGSDQWGNITAGTDLIRKKNGNKAYGMTIPLIKSSSGEKFGKTSTGDNFWLDPKKTSPYEFYQFWVQREDSEVIKYLRYFTFLPDETIERLQQCLEQEPHKREAQKTLAFEVTKLVHDEDAVNLAIKATQVLFGGSLDGLNDETLLNIFKDVPSIECSKSSLNNQSFGILDLLSSAGLCKSKGEARRLIKQGGVYLNNQKVSDETKMLGEEDLASDSIMIVRSGKKKYALANFTN
ncbi:MAG: tyrosine--tRNA ligase [Candidatus Cloacimonadota bacterium]|nr:MAG: tyrosine--tRNA ligase [Candidatus Cloacimonadota bacterium]